MTVLALDDRDERSHVPVDDAPIFPSIAEIPDFEILSVSLRNRTVGLTHGLHRFPAKYIPQIPSWAMQQFAGTGDYVVDPFMGSGTTLVEACRRPGRALGVDIDPLAGLIANAKTTLVGSGRIVELGHIIRERWRGPASRLRTPMDGVRNFSHWFNDHAWGWLQSLFDLLLALQCKDAERRFLLAVFSSTIRWVSNADDQTQKTYVSGTLKKSPPPVPPTFWRAFERALIGLRELELTAHPNCEVVARIGDAGALQLRPSEVDLIVTSPPYVDSVDYMYNTMLEYFWLGPLLGVQTRAQFNSMRREVIGAKNPTDKSFVIPDALADLVEPEHINPQRLPAIISYWERMSAHFREGARVLKCCGHYVLVIGNSQSGKGIVPVHDALLRLAALSGLELRKAFAYRIRRHYMKFPRKGRGGIILVDWVLVPRKVGTEVTPPERLPLPRLTLGENEVAN